MLCNGASDGVFETDGHAAVLMGFYHTLRRFGIAPDKEVWPGYCRGLKWLFHLSGRSQCGRLLYTDSEPADRVTGSYDIYSNVLALRALAGARELFVQHGLNPMLLDDLHDALRTGIYESLRDSESGMWLQGRLPDGRVQQHMCHSIDQAFPFRHVMFQASPVTLAADGLGLWPERDMDSAWFATSLQTFQSIYRVTCDWLKEHGEPVFFAGNAYGIVPPTVESQNVLRATSIQFGHGLFTEAAMLLDQTGAFEKAIVPVAQGVNNPHFGPKYQYVTPHLCFEGGEPFGFGDVGNLVNSAEMLKIIRIMAGVDDSRGELRIMPRIPRGWRISVKDMPVALARNGRRIDGLVSYEFRHDHGRLEARVRTEPDPGPYSLRLGPLPGDCSREKVDVSPREDWQLLAGGDAGWILMPGLSKREWSVTVSQAGP